MVLVATAREDSRFQIPDSRGPADARSSDEVVIRVLPGPQKERFEKEGLATFLGTPFRVSPSSDRRGVRLEGSPIACRQGPDIPPEGTALGGIQVPGDGQPIILGPDRPVTGGYAKIATVIGADFPLVAQALAGTAVRFREVTLAEALAAFES
jgi:allophanate hydrolase subunit 2